MAKTPTGMRFLLTEYARSYDWKVITAPSAQTLTFVKDDAVIMAYFDIAHTLVNANHSNGSDVLVEYSRDYATFRDNQEYGHNVVRDWLRG